MATEETGTDANTKRNKSQGTSIGGNTTTTHSMTIVFGETIQTPSQLIVGHFDAQEGEGMSCQGGACCVKVYACKSKNINIFCCMCRLKVQITK
jgi:hypothetical protein